MNSAEIREAFLAFFERQGHTRVASSPLVPGNDPTLLFTNAGMVQFKDVFLGQESRPYTRAASSQRCVRAGGKHNDLENVGYTARHHTFFEMLGNFSFGDYFKEDAIRFAWQLLTEVYGLPAERLWATVYAEDDEAYDIWREQVGLPADRIVRIGDNKGRRYASDNFWQMADTGPCGPCTEIFYDHGPEVEGGPPGSPDEDGDRYIEIWNLVFMQFDMQADGSLQPLPAPCVDTGMGLERLAAVLQHVHSNFEIDLFQHLLAAARAATGAADPDSPSLRVIADHIRACAFLVCDGVLPTNEGRGYVLRRILRRACRHGHKLGTREPFFHRLVAPLAEIMGDAYPELRRQQAQVERVILGEEEQFARTLDNGMRILDEEVAGLSEGTIPGELAFRLYDTYGFPIDLTADIARERGLGLDMDGFDAQMAAQRERARGASQFAMDDYARLDLEGETRFTGYDGIEGDASVTALLRDGEPVESLAAGEAGVVVLDRTPFYAESGGQVGDCGVIDGDGPHFEVEDTQKSGGHHLHQGVLQQGVLRVGDPVTARVQETRRRATMLNHSATHLLHAALRRVLGEHVTQKGSLVDAERLRFDFSHFEALTPEQLEAIESQVNEQIRRNTAVQIEHMDMQSAMARGAMALFGEKYGDEVRVLTMGGGYSVELCGGTHVARTGDIGLMHIVAESGISAGVRRIEALTGARAMARFQAVERQLDDASRVLKTRREDLVGKLEQLLASQRQLDKDVQRLKAKLASGVGSDLSTQAVDVDGVKVLAATLEGADVQTLRTTMDRMKDKLGSAVILLAATKAPDKVSLVAGVTRDLTDRFKAGDLVRDVAAQLGGKGGGRPDMAQGGGADAAALPAALQSVRTWVERHR
jgi:alanyl-tRNA synthetase